jgi:hypothetical protein
MKLAINLPAFAVALMALIESLVPEAIVTFTGKSKPPGGINNKSTSEAAAPVAKIIPCPLPSKTVKEVIVPAVDASIST